MEPEPEPELQLEPEPEPEPQMEPEPEPELEPGPWLELLAALDLADDTTLADAGKTEDDETLQLRVDILEAEEDGAKMAAFNRLVRKTDEELAAKDAALAAKDVELAELRARLAEA